MQTLEHLRQYPIIAILRRLTKSNGQKAIQALYEGGIRTVEITADSEEVETIIKWAKEMYPSMKVGAGTVLTAERAEQLMSAGADFILSPVVNEQVIKKVVTSGCVMIPGAFTPTEILTAHEYGAQIIKVFPAHLLGSKYMKDLSGPLPFVECAPTGGIDAHNIVDYLKAGAVCAGVSSAFAITNEEITEEKKEDIIQRAKAMTNIVNEFQREKYNENNKL